MVGNRTTVLSRLWPVQNALWWCAGLIIAANGLLGFLVLVWPRSLLAVTANGIAGLGLILCLGLLLRAGLRRPGRSTRSWLLLITGVNWTVGHTICTLYKQFHDGQAALPSWADGWFLAAYVLLMLGLLSLFGRGQSRAPLARVVIEGIVTVAAFATVSWYFLFGPMVLQSGQSALLKLACSAYPLGDLLLLVCLIMVTAHANPVRLGPGPRIIIPALGVAITTDVASQYLALRGGDAGGANLNVGWFLAYVLIGLAALGAGGWSIGYHRGDRPVGGAIGAASLWRALLPYVHLPVIAALAGFASQDMTDTRLDVGAYLGGALILALVLMHQSLIIVESWKNARALDGAYRTVAAHLAHIEDLQILATTDPMTDLPNYRAIVHTLDQALLRARCTGTTCALLIVDVDRFKAINDTYGHMAGDAVLRDLGVIMRLHLPAEAVLGRWGGEEFIAVLPGHNLECARAVGERMRGAAESHRFVAVPGATVTCSIGVAACPVDGLERDSLIAAADRAMYAAKRLGRNQVCTAADPDVAVLDTVEAGQGMKGEVEFHVVQALAALVDTRDQEIGLHQYEVAELTTRLAFAMGCNVSEIRYITMAGQLHDLGKLAISDAILHKPGPLTSEEWALMCQHPTSGAVIIDNIPALQVVAPLVRGHHERWDGQGYPGGLAGMTIPLGARIIAVADAFKALTTDRPYRMGCPGSDAILELRRCAGTQFDPAVVDALELLLVEDETIAWLGVRQEGDTARQQQLIVMH